MASGMAGALVRAHGLGKCYKVYARPRDRLMEAFHARRRHDEVWAVRGVSFELRRGEAIGIIGRNGSGKSTLLQMIAGTLQPTEGEVHVDGRVNALLELGSGFNPDFTGRENLRLAAAILGMDERELARREPEVEEFAAIGAFMDRPLRTYSSGMVMRLAFATQTVLDPDVLIVDEALAVGDMAFQIKCFARMNDLRRRGTAVLFVSHHMATVLSFCERAIYLRDGEVAGFGVAAQMAQQYERDILATKMTRAAPNERGAPPATPAREAATGEGYGAATLACREVFASVAAGAPREGSGRAVIESFAMLRAESGEVATLISPLEDVVGAFVVRFAQPFDGAVHLSIQVMDRTGAALAVIRDSHFERPVHARADERFEASMRFRLPFQAGVYYCRIALLLFPAGAKYPEGRFDFEAAEIADHVAQGAHFTVLPYARHPIPVPVLQEAALEWAPLREASPA